MLQVSVRCAHIWDPNSVYIETKHFVMPLYKLVKIIIPVDINLRYQLMHINLCRGIRK